MPRLIAHRSIRPVLLSVLALLVIGPPAQAAFPGANGKIAFGRVLISGDDFNYEVFTMSADGTGATNLTNDPVGDLHPAWSPDGTKLAFSRNFDDEIYVMNADGTGQTNITKNRDPDTRPAWSPDGAKIAFSSVRDPDGELHIYTMNADGSKQTRLTDTATNDTDPAWSPDGTKIAFARCDPYAPINECAFHGEEIYVMNADGTGQTRVGPTGSSYPAWAPDGTKIAFFWYSRFSPSKIWTMDPDGTDLASLSEGISPAWSPDGTKIAFADNRNGLSGIYVMNADGTGQTNLTNGPNDSEPDWSPLPTQVGPKRGDFTNAAQFCKAERDFLGESAFADKYGTNGNGTDAHGKCVSENH